MNSQLVLTQMYEVLDPCSPGYSRTASLGRKTIKPRMCVGRNRYQPWGYRYCRITPLSLRPHDMVVPRFPEGRFGPMYESPTIHPERKDE